MTNAIARNVSVTDATRRRGVVLKVVGQTAVVEWAILGADRCTYELVTKHELLSDLEVI